MLFEQTRIDRFEHKKKCVNHVMQDEDVRQVDTTGKWLQFVYCLPSFLCVIFFTESKSCQNEEYQQTVTKSKQFWW